MIEWRNETRKLRELIPWDRNPRQIRQEQAVRLSESLDEFGQVQAICIEPSNEIVDGHQRRAVWAAAEKFGADYEVDVRVASRELTEREKRKLSVYLHKGAHGEWDFDALAEWGMEDELLEWGFEEAELGGISDGLWDDMPDLAELETQIAFHTIDVKFASKDDMDSFSELTGQTVTTDTTHIWFNGS